MFRSWVLKEIWIIYLSSACRYVNEFIQIICVCEQNSFKLRCETVIGIVLRYSHQGCCCLLYYLCEITGNNGIHIYLSGCNCGFGFEEKYWRIDGFGEKKAQIGGFGYPYSPPLPPRFRIKFLENAWRFHRGVTEK